MALVRPCAVTTDLTKDVLIVCVSTMVGTGANSTQTTVNV